RCQASFVCPYKSPQKLSFISARKCWKCSLIGIIFAIGCRSPFQERLSLVRQSQLTPSRLLHNQRYVTIKRTAPCPGLPSMPFRYIRTVWTRRDSNPHLLTGQVNVLPLHHGPTPRLRRIVSHRPSAHSNEFFTASSAWRDSQESLSLVCQNYQCSKRS